MALAVLPLCLVLPAYKMRPLARIAARAHVLAALGSAVRWLAIPAALALTIIAGLVQGTGYSATYLLPFAARGQGLGAGATSLLLLPFVAGCIVGAPLTGWLADRMGPQKPLIVCFVASALALTWVAWAGAAPVVIVAGLLATGFAVASGLSLTTTLMMSLARRLNTGVGTALGGLRVGQSLGPSVGPPISGFVFVHWGLAAAYFQLVASLLAAAMLVASTSRPSVASTGTSGSHPIDRARNLLQRDDEP